MEQRRHSVRSAGPVERLGHFDRRRRRLLLVRDERPASIITLRPVRRSGVSGLRLVGRRLWRRLRRGVILRRRRDDDHHRRKILAGGGKRRANDEQRKRSGKSNEVRLHRHVSCLQFTRRAARPTDARARGRNPICSRPTPSAYRVARCASERRIGSLDPSETISAHRPEGPRSSPSYHILRRSGILRLERERWRPASHNNGVAEGMRRSRARPGFARARPAPSGG